MGKSRVEIWNMALGILGISQKIANPDEQSVEARECRAFFDNALELLLEEVDWPFAERTVTLQSLGSPPVGWAYRYQYPNDCLLAREIKPQGFSGSTVDIDGTVYPQDRKIPFRIVENESSSGRAIVADLDNAVLVYTARITDTNVWPMTAILALSYLLATFIASPLAAAPGMAEKAGNAYTGILLKSTARQFNEGQERSEPESEFTAARR